MDEVIGLFPTPFMRVAGALPAALVSGLVEHFKPLAGRDNSSSPNLSHTEMLKPADSPLLVETARASSPRS
jgi:hypothetical protein